MTYLTRVRQVLDPIDGTKGFMTGQGYMIGLSLLMDGEAIIGVMGRWVCIWQQCQLQSRCH